MRKCCNITLQFKVIGLFGKEEWALIFKNANIIRNISRYLFLVLNKHY